MTDTPETNAAEFPCMRWLSRDHPMGVRSELAKRLERERYEAREQLTAVTEQRDRLAEALRSIKNELGVPQPEYPAPVANAVKIANEALQSLTTNEL